MTSSVPLVRHGSLPSDTASAVRGADEYTCCRHQLNCKSFRNSRPSFVKRPSEIPNDRSTPRSTTYRTERRCRFDPCRVLHSRFERGANRAGYREEPDRVSTEEISGELRP